MIPETGSVRGQKDRQEKHIAALIGLDTSSETFGNVAHAFHSIPVMLLVLLGSVAGHGDSRIEIIGCFDPNRLFLLGNSDGDDTLLCRKL